MRSTLTIDDNIAKALKDTAHRTGKSYKEVVNETLRAGLTAKRIISQAKPYKVKPVSLGKVPARYNLTKSLHLSDQLENEEIIRELDMKK